jgi:N-acetylmuramoyl-L-alanine amidase
LKVYIDIGHGGNDPGAVSKPFIEHEMAMVTGLAMADQFHKRGADVKVEPGNLEITASARLANSFGADILLSVHYNAGGGDRGEVIYSWKSGALLLANIVADGLKMAGQSVVRVYKSKANSAGNAEYFGILRAATMPAVIIEPAFIDNAVDRQLVDTVEKQKQMGVYMANAIADAYGLEDDEMIYKTVNDVPEWGKPLIQKLISRKSLAGDGKGNINLPESTLKTLVILEREGVLK